MSLPDRHSPICLPAFLHDWPVKHIGFLPPATFAMRLKAVVTLGELNGRNWGFIYDLDGVGDATRQDIMHRLNAAIEGSIKPPPPGPLPPAVEMPRMPGVILDWLLRASYPRQMEVALRHLVDRVTLEELGQEMNVTRERVHQLVELGKRRRSRHA